MKGVRILKVIAVTTAILMTGFISEAKEVTVKKPVKLSIIDVAGNLQLSQSAIEAFKTAYPNLVSDIEFIKATSPELAAKIKAQQMANNLDTTLVLTGYDGMASGMELKIWEKILPENNEYFLNLKSNYLSGAKKSYDLFQGYGLTYVYCPGGPMLTYNPDKVKSVPKTPQALLEWAKANPGKFMYARPANSGPGRAFIMGLPYILGDRNPKDPATWDKTLDFLKKLDQYIDYYPSGTGVTFKELSEGSRWIIASHLGWDMNQRILATIPANFKGSFFEKTTWVADSHFMVIPKGLDADRKKVTLALMAWLMQPKQQAMTYDSAYFYPGPALKNIPLSMAPKKSQDLITPAIRAEYENAIKSFPSTTQLDAKAMVQAMDMWDKLIGAKIKK
jgi:putative spermidine/putrescine transport system substrate-binding protein